MGELQIKMRHRPIKMRCNLCNSSFKFVPALLETNVCPACVTGILIAEPTRVNNHDKGSGIESDERPDHLKRLKDPLLSMTAFLFVIALLQVVGVVQN